MFGFYLVGYIAVAASFYWRVYRTAPVMEEMEAPFLTLWVNPEMAEQDAPEETEEIRKAA